MSQLAKLDNHSIDNTGLMHSVFDSLPDAVVVMDNKGRVQACNSAAQLLFGEDFSGEKWSSVIQRTFVPDHKESSCVMLRDGRLLTLVTSPLSSNRGQILVFTEITDNQPLADMVRPGPVADDSDMVAVDPESRKLLALAKRVAINDVSVMICGESGVGKEVMARYIHKNSMCADGPFIAINCAAIPENMLEATLFGYEKGAFTGAHQASPGKFEQAQGGILLLDEISEMALELQAKLLRVLQECEVERLGGRKVIPLNVRVLTTSNRDMKAEVVAGRFREDLFFRLSVFPLYIPPLRERKDDILPLANTILRNIAKSGRAAVPAFTKRAEKLLLQHSWPGNVRELGNVLQRAMILKDAKANRIDVDDLQIESYETPAVSVSSGKVDDLKRLNENLKEHEHDLIIRALKEAMGDRSVVAKRLGISPRTLRYKLAKMREKGIVP